MYEVCIVGGGLAGLMNAIVLSRAGIQVLLIEKRVYPFHRVCGEYISNETLPFLHSLGIYPHHWGASSIDYLQVTSPKGTRLQRPLDLGGFGLSRYTLDEKLYQLALQAGATILTGNSVENIVYDTPTDAFRVVLSDHSSYESRYVLGTYGKRTRLDKQLQRDFMFKRSPYIGVKYHIRTDFPPTHIALHNFKDGYCGLSAVEEGKYNLCYLTTRENLRQHGSIQAMEEAIVYQNPYLKSIKANADFLFEKPEVINEISFAPKYPVENHILMCGDAAGMITPLCGNGMAMAIHSASLLSGYMLRAQKENWPRTQLEKTYTHAWQRLFARRLWVGRMLQTFFGHPIVTDMAIRTLRMCPPLAAYLVKQTHGNSF